MGNNYSDLKNPFSSKQVPKHLKPMKKKKKKVQIGQAIDTPLPPPSKEANKPHPDKPAINRYEENRRKVEILFDNKDDNEKAEEETVLVGSGPRSAFRWFKGRRYLNYASQVCKPAAEGCLKDICTNIEIFRVYKREA